MVDNRANYKACCFLKEHDINSRTELRDYMKNNSSKGIIHECGYDGYEELLNRYY